MTEQHDEWGPWIEHDGTGCPLMVGQMAHVKAIDCFGDPQEQVGTCQGHADEERAWDWSFYREFSPKGYNYSKIIRYRIRYPRAMRMLRRIAELPEKVVEAA